MEENIEDGDELLVGTETNGWSTRFEVLDAGPNETKIRSSGGKEYWISTHSSPRTGEVNSVAMRDVEEHNSYGVVERVEVFKDE